MDPKSFYTGDTVSWSVSLPEYPSSEWSLTYFLVSPSGKIKLDAQPDADSGYVVSLVGAETEQYVPGEYAWQATVTNGPARYTVGTGRVLIQAGFSSVESFESRSNYRVALAYMEQALVDYHKSGQGHVLEIDGGMGGKMTFRSAKEIQEHIDWLKRQIAYENAMNAMLAGRNPGRVITRF